MEKIRPRQHAGSSRLLNNYPRHLFQLLAIGLVLFAPASVRCQAIPGAAPQSLDFTVLHTNDIHGHIFPFAYTEVGRSPNEVPSVGGAARRATLIRRLRQSIHHPVLLVDSGDLFTRGPLTNAYEGLADVEAMNALGYDVLAVGNNEFKAKDATEQNDAAGAQAALLQVVKRSRFPWICANARDEHGAFLEGVEPYVVRVIDGVRIGFLGLTAPRSASYPQTKGWSITDPIAAAKEWIPKARAHCDILIAVTHIGVPMDMLLATQTKGLDAIVGGDSHTFLYKAVDIPSADGRRVPIVQDGEFGANLGRFDLHFVYNAHDGWTLASYHEELIPVRPPLTEAPDIAAALEPWARPYLARIARLPAIGKTPAERSRQTNQIAVDAMRAMTAADIAVGTVGGEFNVFHSALVTPYDVYAAYPFKNHVAISQLSGKDLQALITAHPDSVISGAKPTDPAAVYKAAFVDFNAHSSYGLAESQITDTGLDMRRVIIDYLKKTYPLKASR